MKKITEIDVIEIGNNIYNPHLEVIYVVLSSEYNHGFKTKIYFLKQIEPPINSENPFSISFDDMIRLNYEFV